jgi:uncharacterized protein YidB (DUF937 family)
MLNRRIGHRNRNPTEVREMGLLDDVTAAAGGGGSQRLVGAAMEALEQAGGVDALGGLLGRFQSMGLQDAVGSWLGQGDNAPISADQAREAVGPERVDEIARSAGVSGDEAAGGLAALLPQLVDRLSPRGELPGGGSLTDRLGDLSSLLR